MTHHTSIRSFGRGAALLGLAAGILLAGCSGPTRKGQEARNLANLKFDAVRSRVDYDQADQAFRSGNFVKAKQHLDAAIEKSADQADYWVLLGRVYLETGALQDAIASLDQAVKVDETNADARYFLGITSERRDRPIEAVEHYLAALEIAPENSQMLVAAVDVLIGAGMLDDAEVTLREHRAEFEDDAAFLHLSGRVAMMRRAWSRAADELEQSVLLDDSDRWAMEDLARAQIGAGRTEDCLATITRIRGLKDIENDDVELLRLEGRCLAEGGRIREAREVMLDLVNLHPEDIQGWIDFGLVCIECGDMRRVVRAGQRLLVLSPDRFEGYFMLGQAALRSRDHDTAAKLFARAAELAPDRDEPQLALGMTQELRGDYGAAYRAYARVADRNPEDARVRGLLTNVSDSLDD